MTSARTWIGLAVWLLLCYGVAFTASQFGIGEWYDALRKPSWNPPGWVFGPVWSLLYTMMAVAAWLVWREAGGFSGARLALALFLVQLLLNGLWSWCFFGLQRPGLAFLDIVALWIAIAATAAAFRPVSALAAGLLLPYLAWVSFAAALNFTIWRMNV